MSDDDKPVMLFGYDIRKIPCFRNSLLYGISSGLIGGLLAFLTTSNPRVASHSAVGIYAAVTAGYWIQCRTRYIHTLITTRHIQNAMEDAEVSRTIEPDIQEKVEEKLVNA